MLVNRNNYEEFFLLYADGELTPLQVNEVEEFATLHPDLKEELQIILECKFVPEILPVFPKEKLLKNVIWDAENMSETQWQMLQMLDGELPKTQVELLHKKMASDAALQKDWQSLQPTKLIPETIEHPNKQSLYRMREIPKIIWWRWAAAASVLLLMGLFLINQNKKNNSSQIASASKPNKNISNNKSPETIASTTFPNSATKATNNTSTKNIPQNNTVTATSNTSNTTKNTNPSNAINTFLPDQKNTVAVNITAPKNNIDTGDGDAIEPEQIRGLTSLSVLDAPSKSAEQPTLSLPGQFYGSSTPNMVLVSNNPQSFTTDDIHQHAEDEYVSIAGAKIKKQKLRGLLRTVGRGLVRTFSKSKVEAAPTQISE